MVEYSRRRPGGPLRGKGGLVMVGVLAVLGGIIWWDRGHGKPREPDSDPQALEFIGISKPDNVTRIEVRGIAQPYTLVKQGDQWRLAAPIQAPAAKQPVEDAVKGLLEASVGKYLNDRVPAGQLQKYGLDKPGIEIVLTDGGQHDIQVGSEWRSGELFAREKGDQRVFALSSFAVDGFKNKKPEDFRDKSLLPIPDTEKVRRVEIFGPKGEVAAERRGEEWMITRPGESKADSMEVNSLVSQTKTSEAQSFIQGGAKELPKYGLDRARMTVNVTDDKGTHTLLFGAPAPDKEPKVYALRKGEPDVMVVAKSTFDAFFKGPSDLRSREMLGFQTEKARRVSVRAPAGSYELEKRGEEWWLVKPVTARADAGKVSSLLFALSGPASRFVEEKATDLNRYGLASPQVDAKVEVTGSPGMSLLIGAQTTGGDKAYYAKTGSSPAVYEVSDFTFTDINQKPDDLKAK